MQLRPDQLAARARARPAAAVHGARRRAAAGAGGRRRDPRRGARAPATASARCSRVSGAHFDWSRPARRIAGDEPVRRAAADRDPHPRRQAGQGRLRGAAALLRDAVRRRDHADAPAAAGPPAARQRVVQRARRAPASSLRVDPVERQRAAAVDRAAPGRAGPARARRRRRQRRRWRSLPTASKATCWPRTRSCRSSRCCTRRAS